MSQDNLSQIVAIYALSIVFAMLGFLNFEVAGFSLAFPLLDVIAIYYFRIFKKVFSLWFIFFLGLIADSLSGELLGLTSLIYILLIKIFEYAESRLSPRDDFEQVLKRFLVFLLSFLFSKWLILSLIHYAGYSFWVIIVQFLITATCYVFMHKIYSSYFDI